MNMEQGHKVEYVIIFVRNRDKWDETAFGSFQFWVPTEKAKYSNEEPLVQNIPLNTWNPDTNDLI